MALVYLVTNLVNGKRYIGVTKWLLCQRKAKHLYAARSGRRACVLLTRSIRKYGEEMFRFSVLKRCEHYDVALAEERRLIATLKPEYNITEGGDGAPKYCPTAEKSAKQSARNLQPEARARWRKYAPLGPKSLARAVVCLNDRATYESVSAAARHYGVHKSSILEICEKKPLFVSKRHRNPTVRLSTRGLVFRFISDTARLNDDPQAVLLASRQGRGRKKALGIENGVAATR